MKNISWRLGLTAALFCLTLCGRITSAHAADQPAGNEERLQRLERRLNELAERQEMMIQRLAAHAEQPGARAIAGPEARPGPVGAPGPEHIGRSLPVPGIHPGAVPNAHKPLHDLLGLLFLVGIICNILLAIWIFTDIRKRGEGSGLFIALALVAGIPAAIIYSLVRIGDRRPQP
jgi:hypothetical protein